MLADGDVEVPRRCGGAAQKFRRAGLDPVRSKHGPNQAASSSIEGATEANRLVKTLEPALLVEPEGDLAAVVIDDLVARAIGRPKVNTQS